LNLGELFEIKHERDCNVIERAVRLATAGEIHVRHAIGKCQFAVAGEAVKHEGKSLVAFDVARTFEEFIEDAAD